MPSSGPHRSALSAAPFFLAGVFAGFAGCGEPAGQPEGLARLGDVEEQAHPVVVSVDTLFHLPRDSVRQPEPHSSNGGRMVGLLGAGRFYPRRWVYHRTTGGVQRDNPTLSLSETVNFASEQDYHAILTSEGVWSDSAFTMGVRFCEDGLGLDSAAEDREEVGLVLPGHWSTLHYPEAGAGDTLAGIIVRTTHNGELHSERGELVVVLPEGGEGQLSFRTWPCDRIARRHRWSVDSAGVRADTVETEYFAEALGLVQRTKRIQGPGVDLLDSLVLHRISFRWPFPLPQAPAPPEGDVADLFPFDSTRWRIYRKVDHVRGDTTAWAARWGKVREENGQPVWREWHHELASVDDEPTEAGQPVGTDWAYAGERVMRRPVGEAHWSAWLWFQPLPHNMQGQYWIQTPWIPTYSLEEFLRVEETGHGGQAYHVTYHWQEEYRGIWVKDQAHRYEPGIGLVHQTVEESGSGRRWDLEVWWIRNTPWLRSSGP